MRVVRVVSAAVALVAGLGAAPSMTVGTATARRLAADALNGRSFEYTRTLTETIGGRLTGSPAYNRAVEWAASEFRSFGAVNVALEPFSMARAWDRGGPASASIVSPVVEPLTVASLGWAPSTPDGGIEGEVIAVRPTASGLDGRVRGRIVLADDEAPPDFDRRVRDAGGLALLVADPDPGNLLVARVRDFGGDLAALPCATVSHDDVARLRQLISRSPVRVAMSLPNGVSPGAVTVRSVVAEIKGREQPDEWVLVGAHLDSWDLATGAQDNATGVAMVVDAARAIAAVGRAPRRTIKFALWGGEEQGLLGSSAYVRAHGPELERAVAILNADAGTGRIIGWTTPGREDVANRVRTIARPVLEDLGAAAVDRSMQYAFDSDGGPFLRRGVPVLDLNADDSRYEEIHHRSTDTIERVNAHNLAVGAATVAVTAYAIADAPNRVAPHTPVKEPSRRSP
jgi:carboxypeptidase Q